MIAGHGDYDRVITDHRDPDLVTAALAHRLTQTSGRSKFLGAWAPEVRTTLRQVRVVSTPAMVSVTSGIVQP